jgi:small subunit ribosomal protein S20
LTQIACRSGQDSLPFDTDLGRRQLIRQDPIGMEVRRRRQTRDREYPEDVVLFGFWDPTRFPGLKEHSEEVVNVASHASALKAHRQNVKRRDRNRALRSKLRTALKNIRAAIDKKDLDAAKTSLDATLSLIDKMAGKGIIHDNAAARYKSRIVKRLAGKTATK